MLLGSLGVFLFANGLKERFNLRSEKRTELNSQIVVTPLSDAPPTVQIVAQHDTSNGINFLSEDSNLKKYLIEKLGESGWSDQELSTLRSFLSDERAVFLVPEIRKNVSHVETKKLYEHNLNRESIELAGKFWDVHRESVMMGLQKYSVPGSIVLAILKVETNFGRNIGKRSIFNVFWSLSVGDNPEVLEILKVKYDLDSTQKKRLNKRAKWACKELRDLIFMAHNQGMDPLGIMGSWAGAFGLGQFIPSSFRAYGRDGDGDDVINLAVVADATASIAYYLLSNGWSSGSKNSKKKALMRYNISEPYADCILSLSDMLEKEIKGLQQ